MGLTFGYHLIDSDETRKIYEQMLEDDREKFVAWRSEKDQRPHLPLDAAYSIWWLSKGPTAFATGADAIRYRRELFSHIQEKLTV